MLKWIVLGVFFLPVRVLAHRSMGQSPRPHPRVEAEMLRRRCNGVWGDKRCTLPRNHDGIHDWATIAGAIDQVEWSPLKKVAERDE
jgi:hypothetical protein